MIYSAIITKRRNPAETEKVLFGPIVVSAENERGADIEVLRQFLAETKNAPISDDIVIYLLRYRSNERE